MKEAEARRIAMQVYGFECEDDWRISALTVRLVQAGCRAWLEEAKAALLSNKRLYVDPSATYHFKEWLNAKLKEQP